MGDDTAGRLRFGLLLSGTTLRSWQADVVRSLLEVAGVELALLVIDSRPAPERDARHRVTRLLGSRTRLWDAYSNGWVGRRSRALCPIDMSDVLGNLPRVEVEVSHAGRSE